MAADTAVHDDTRPVGDLGQIEAAHPRRRASDQIARGPLAWLTPARVAYGALYAAMLTALVAVIAMSHKDNEVREHASVFVLGMLTATVVWVPVALTIHRRAARQQFERERLLERLVTVSDLERRRVAAEVHDGALQDLVGLSFRLESLADGCPAAQADELRQAAVTARGLMTRMRSLLQSMYPVDVPVTGWHDGFEDLTVALRRMGVTVHVDVPRQRLAPLNEVVALRMTREAMRNAAAHAEARNVWVRATYGAGQIVVTVADDGIGFDPDTAEARRRAGHFGMQLLHDLACEAGAALTITSRSGAGTQVRLEMQERRSARPRR